MKFKSISMVLWTNINLILVAKGSHMCGLELWIILRHSPVTCLNSIQFLFSLAFNLDWAMFQLNFENTFLYGYMHEEIYKEQPSDYVA